MAIRNSTQINTLFDKVVAKYIGYMESYIQARENGYATLSNQVGLASLVMDFVDEATQTDNPDLTLTNEALDYTINNIYGTY
jgi:hypothetical protein